MENRRSPSSVALAVGLLAMMSAGFLVGQSTAASFTICYRNCFLLCAITGNSLGSCAGDCLKDCLLQPPSSLPPKPSSVSKMGEEMKKPASHRQNLYFCKLGCAFSLCSNFSSRATDPREEKVAACVDSCSTKCTVRG
ncbi:unnamed protein product [Linum tenue]|uniref:Thionin-like protein 2 n=1 Tax=Linum tenue TaxID=586396 RepID=A0AAV0KLN0_9ROSI|nr:unnamed protein product [Linum tenue]